MKRFIPYLKHFRPVRWHFCGAVLAGLLYAVASGLGLPLAADVVFPIIFKESADPAEGVSWFQSFLTDWLGSLDENHLLIGACLWLPVIFLIRAVGGYLNGYLLNYCGFRAVEGIRYDIFEKLQALPVAYFQQHRSGDLLARVVGDTELIRQVVTKSSADVIKQPATLLVALGFLVHKALENEGSFIVLISVLTIPICIFPIQIAGKKLRLRAKQLQKTAGVLSAHVSETLQMPQEIRSYNLQEKMTLLFRGQVRNLIRSSMKVIKYRLMISPAIELVAAVALAFALYFGSREGMDLKSFTAIAMALYLCYEPIKKVGAVHSRFKQGAAAIDRLEDILHAEGELPEPENPRIPADFSGGIEFEDVSFSYGDLVVLSDIRVQIAPGECVALIGESGAGKSTFANLIPRFFDVTTGAVKVGGQDVREWKKSELRSRVAVVSQTPVLFQGTIRENILLGRPDATEAEVEAAARDANAHDFIVGKAGGYDQDVTERGTSLSGGQRQRIALARAFLKDAPILILDEATSALDNESEEKIQEALARLVKNRTTLIIAHRLSTTRIANRVLTFDRGRIVQDEAQG